MHTVGLPLAPLGWTPNPPLRLGNPALLHPQPPAPCSLMSDAPAHQLFVLLGPVDETQASAAAAVLICGPLGQAAMAARCAMNQTCQLGPCLRCWADKSRPCNPAIILPPLPSQMQNALPDVLAVVQVALEGAISRRSVQASLAAGQLPQVRGEGKRCSWVARHRCMQRAGLFKSCSTPSPTVHTHPSPKHHRAT